MANAPAPRALQPMKIVHRGLRRPVFGDLYHFFVVKPWWVFFACILAGYAATNTLFAAAYYASPGCIENARADSFLDMFFFSVQTMVTIGYGKMAPVTTYANVLVTLEALMGVCLLAVVTGLTFAKFSRPTARVTFSGVAVITTRDGVLSLMARMANERQSYLVDVNLFMVLAMNDFTSEGEMIRRFHTLTLTRTRAATFALSWTAIHVIDQTSPLLGVGSEELEKRRAEVILIITGIDEALVQTVHARVSYDADRILFGQRFADIVTQLPDGGRVLDHARLHETIPETG